MSPSPRRRRKFTESAGNTSRAFPSQPTDKSSGVTTATDPGTPSLARPCRCGLSRRGLFAAAAGFAAGAAMRPPGARANPTVTPDAPPFRIDVHHHLTPPDYVAAAHGHFAVGAGLGELVGGQVAR